MKNIKSAILLSALMISGTALADLNTGLVASWDFNDCTANDASGHGHNGVMNGNLQCVVGDSNDKAFLFNGIDSYVSIADEQSVFSLEDMTISVFIKPSNNQNISSGYPVVIDKSHAAGAGGWVIQTPGIGRSLSFFFGYCDPNIGCSNDDQKQRIVVKPNQWNHLVVVKTKNVVANYLNGNLLSKKTFSFSTYPKTTLPLFIGALNADGTRAFYKGIIDDVKVYNRALSTTEISALYAVTKPVGGTLQGFNRYATTCDNTTTGKKVTIATSINPMFDCEKAGLVVNPKDNVTLTIKGNAH